MKRKIAFATAFVAASFAVFMLVLFVNTIFIRRISPSKVDLAKIALLLELNQGEGFHVSFFDFRYNHIGPDPIGHCGVYLQGLDQATINRIRCNGQPFDKDSYPDTHLFLSKTFESMLRRKNLYSGVWTTASALIASKNDRGIRFWVKPCAYAIFYDPDTSGSIYLSGEGELFLRDAVVRK